MKRANGGGLTCFSKLRLAQTLALRVHGHHSDGVGRVREEVPQDGVGGSPRYLLLIPHKCTCRNQECEHSHFRALGVFAETVALNHHTSITCFEFRVKVKRKAFPGIQRGLFVAPRCWCHYSKQSRQCCCSYLACTRRKGRKRTRARTMSSAPPAAGT